MRQWLWTTPGLLRLMSVLLIALLVGLGVISTAVLAGHRAAGGAIGAQSSAQLTEARELYVALADADATASSGLLRDGLESEVLRERYLDDLERASHLAIAAADHGDATVGARDAARTIAAALTVYAGRVDAARAHSRLGNPVGAAYMRAASTQMRDEILPAATALWVDAATSLDDDYRGATEADDIVVLLVIAAVALAAIIAVQFFLAARTNRMVNLWLAGAAVAMLTVVVSAAVVFGVAREQLADTRREASDVVESLSSARMLALQMQADVNLALVDRENRTEYFTAFDETGERLDQMLALAVTGASGTDRAPDVRNAVAALSEYRAVEAEVRDTELRNSEDDHDDAVRMVSDEETGQAAAWSTLDDALQDTVTDAEQDVARDAKAADRWFAVVLVVALAAVVIAAALTGVGLHRRIEDYR